MPYRIYEEVEANCLPTILPNSCHTSSLAFGLRYLGKSSIDTWDIDKIAKRGRKELAAPIGIMASEMWLLGHGYNVEYVAPSFPDFYVPDGSYQDYVCLVAGHHGISFSDVRKGVSEKDFVANRDYYLHTAKPIFDNAKRRGTMKETVGTVTKTLVAGKLAAGAVVLAAENSGQHTVAMAGSFPNNFEPKAPLTAYLSTTGGGMLEARIDQVVEEFLHAASGITVISK